jgi:signal transduction histidine kinase
VRIFRNSAAAYVTLLAGAFVVAVLGSWLIGLSVDQSAYDEMFRRYRHAPWQPESALLVVDERTLDSIPGSDEGLRHVLAQALEIVAAAKPKAVAVDFLLTKPKDPAVDAELAAAFRKCPNLVLGSQLLSDGWEEPIPLFRDSAAAIGQVHVWFRRDGVARQIPLNLAYGQVRRWAISLEAFRLSRGADIVETYGRDNLEVGSTVIPTTHATRLMRIRFAPPDRKPRQISVKALLDDRSLAREFTGKVVFLGSTAQTEHDRVFTPYSEGRAASGVEINAEGFETMAHGLFITDIADTWVVLWAAILIAAAGVSFRYLQGWPAYAAGSLVVLAGTFAPYAAFTIGRVLPFTMSASAGWLGGIAAAAYYHLVTRRSLKRSEMEKARYQQAMHFVTHEMRTPLSAIQGSSELITRFALTDEKRKQVALLINSESKRLARMVEIFLNVERLSAGQMELKQEHINIAEMVALCVERSRPLAERKHIAINLHPIGADLELTGDRELMEYACYNLLTNAVKYSPPRTEVTVTGARDGSHVRISVQDQGIGMDQKEVKQIFRKFYRTKKAEESGEAGTGIGLSIVQQIVEQHGGEIDVVSEPGKGSCFTLVLPASALTPAAAKRH